MAGPVAHHSHNMLLVEILKCTCMLVCARDRVRRGTVTPDEFKV